jgi:hypothetical protein
MILVIVCSDRIGIALTGLTMLDRRGKILSPSEGAIPTPGTVFYIVISIQIELTGMIRFQRRFNSKALVAHLDRVV